MVRVPSGGYVTRGRTLSRPAEELMFPVHDRTVSVTAANVRLVVIMAAAALVLATERRAHAQAADGGVHTLHPGPLDGGVPAVPRAGGAPGAFLGPLPFGAGEEKGDESNPERHYPLKPGAKGSLVYEAPQFSAVVAPDGTVMFHDRRIDYSTGKSTFNFDLSDEFVRELTHGTSSRYAKADFLAATFKRRTAMAADVSSKQMRAARTDLLRQLDVIWADTRYRRRERRRIIFLLWQRLETSDASAPSATTTIEAWIRKHLPRGSPDAYGDQEVAAYSRERQGQPAFSPYGSPLEK
jgi:hypothetical protein